MIILSSAYNRKNWEGDHEFKPGDNAVGMA